MLLTLWITTFSPVLRVNILFLFKEWKNNFQQFYHQNKAYNINSGATTPQTKDALQLLEIDPIDVRNITPSIIRKQFRKMALKCHPDIIENTRAHVDNASPSNNNKKQLNFIKITNASSHLLSLFKDTTEQNAD